MPRVHHHLTTAALEFMLPVPQHLTVSLEIFVRLVGRQAGLSLSDPACVSLWLLLPCSTFEYWLHPSRCAIGVWLVMGSSWLDGDVQFCRGALTECGMCTVKTATAGSAARPLLNLHQICKG
jgi:hypothetical protein